MVTENVDKGTPPAALPNREELAGRKERRQRQRSARQGTRRQAAADPFEGLRLPDLETLERLSQPDSSLPQSQQEGAGGIGRPKAAARQRRKKRPGGTG